MGGKRKPKQKQKQKISKKVDTKQKNQALLQHYFPNLCQNKSKAYQNVLKKSNGVIKQQKKLCKQLLQQQTLIIKQINRLFNDVFRDIDHEMINQLVDVMMVRDMKVGQEIVGWMGDKEQKQQKRICNKQAGIVGLSNNNILNDNNDLIDQYDNDNHSQSTITLHDLKKHYEQNCYQNENSFLVNLQQFHYNPIGIQSQKQLFNINSNNKIISSSSQPIFGELKCDSQVGLLQQCNQQLNIIDDTLALVTKPTVQNQIKQFFLQKQVQNKKLIQEQTCTFGFDNKKYQNQSNQIIQTLKNSNNPQNHHTINMNKTINNIQQNNKLCFQNNQQQQHNSQKIALLKQKLKLGINNILNLIQKKQLKKQQAIKFNKYITQLKKQSQNSIKSMFSNKYIIGQKQTNQIRRQTSIEQKQKHVHINLLSQQKRQEQIDHDDDEIIFYQMNYISINKTNNPNQQNYQQNNNQLDILDFILHRNQVQDNRFSSLHNQTQKQFYYKNKDIYLNDKIIQDDIYIQQTVDSSNQEIKNNNNQNKNKQKLQQPSFQLPQQFLRGYQTQHFNTNLFKKIHQCEMQKLQFIQTVQQTLI